MTNQSALDDYQLSLYRATTLIRLDISRLQLWYDTNPIRLRREGVSLRGKKREQADLLARLYGVGLVYEEETVVVVGRREMVEWFVSDVARLKTVDSLRCFVGTIKQEYETELYLGLEKRDPCPAMMEGYGMRTSLSKVLHTVANELPHLRVWKQDPDWDPTGREVQLRESDRLGGILRRTS